MVVDGELGVKSALEGWPEPCLFSVDEYWKAKTWRFFKAGIGFLRCASKHLHRLADPLLVTSFNASVEVTTADDGTAILTHKPIYIAAGAKRASGHVFDLEEVGKVRCLVTTSSGIRNLLMPLNSVAFPWLCVHTWPVGGVRGSDQAFINEGIKNP